MFYDLFIYLFIYLAHQLSFVCVSCAAQDNSSCSGVAQGSHTAGSQAYELRSRQGSPTEGAGHSAEPRPGLPQTGNGSTHGPAWGLEAGVGTQCAAAR